MSEIRPFRGTIREDRHPCLGTHGLTKRPEALGYREERTMAGERGSLSDEFDRGSTPQELVGSLARPLLNAGFDRLPNRLQWTAMTLLGIKVPDRRTEDLWARGVERRDRLLEHTRSVVPDFSIEGTRTLEIGCGPGRILVPMAHAGARAYGIDISSPTLRRCRRFAAERGVDVTLETADSSIPFDVEFDYVYSMAVFMHLPRRTVLEYLIAANESLADDGVCSFTFRDLDHPKSREKLRADRHKHYSTRVRFHTADEVRNYMTIAGFEDVTVRKDEHEIPSLVALGR